MKLEALCCLGNAAYNARTADRLHPQCVCVERTVQRALLIVEAMKKWPGADYGFLAPPRSANEPRPPPDGAQYTASFPVKYLGSEPAQHYADYEGCLQIMNKLFTVHQLNSRRRRKRRSSVEGGGLVLTFTPKRLFIVNKDTQVLEEMCKLESVYLVHPHPTKDRLLGVLTDNWMSGTLHCSVYVTLDQSTGSDVLYGFRKACRIWMDLNQSPLLHTTPTESGPSTAIPSMLSTPGPSSVQPCMPGEQGPISAILSMPSGEYDKLESKSEQPPTGILISLSDSELHLDSTELKQKVSPTADSNGHEITELKQKLYLIADSNGREITELNADIMSLDLSSDGDDSSVENFIPLLTSQGSTSTESDCNSLSPLLFSVGSSTTNCTRSRTAKRSPLLSTSTMSESRPLLQNQESDSMESRHLLFGEGSSSEGRNVEFKPLLLCGDRVCTGDRMVQVPGERSSTSTESRSFSVRRVSFAPSVLNSEVSAVRGESTEEKSITTKLMSNLNSLKSLMAGRSGSSSYTPSHAHFPRLFPREYPPPTSPPDASHPHTSQASQPHSPPTEEPSGCADLIDLNSEPSFKTVTTNSGRTVDGTNSVSMFHSLSVDSIHRIERSSSTPALYVKPGWQASQTSSVVLDTTSSQQLHPPANTPSSSLQSVSSTSSSSIVSSACSSLSSFESSSNSSRGLKSSESSSLHRSIHQLLSVSSCATQSDWTSDGEVSAPSSQSVLKLLDPSTSESSSATASTTSQESTVNRTESIVNKPCTKEAECTCESGESSVESGESSIASSQATLARLFQDLAKQTSQVSSQFSTMQRMMTNSSGVSDASSDQGIAKLFQEQASQVSTAASSLSSELSRLLPSQASTSSCGNDSATNSVLSGNTMAGLFDSSSSSATTSAKPQSSQSSSLSSQITSSSGWSDASLPKLPSQPSSKVESDQSLSAALLALTQSALCTSFTVSGSKVIDLPSLMETLKHVTSLLASSHAILDLSLSTLKEKIAAQPSSVCVCTCQQTCTGPSESVKMKGRAQIEDASVSQSEPVLTKPGC